MCSPTAGTAPSSAVVTGDLRRRVQRLNRTNRGLHLRPAASAGELRMLQQLSDRVRLTVGDACRIQPLQHLVRRARREDGLDLRSELVTVGDPVGVGGVAGIVGQLRAPQHIRAEPQPFALVLDGRTAPLPRRRCGTCRTGRSSRDLCRSAAAASRCTSRSTSAGSSTRSASRTARPPGQLPRRCARGRTAPSGSTSNAYMPPEMSATEMPTFAGCSGEPVTDSRPVSHCTSRS